jgi:hypothetical protein
VIITRRKILRHGASGFTSPPKEGVLGEFLSPSIASTVFEPANLGSNGKHTNYYTIETTLLTLKVVLFGM